MNSNLIDTDNSGSLNGSQKKRRLVLIGMMGTGKSTVGKLAAKSLGFDFFDTDAEYEKVYAEKIAETFEKHGEQVFRARETEILKSLIKKDNIVLSTGGGIILSDENISIIKQSATVAQLYADPAVILKRVQSNNKRPLLNGKKTVEDIAKIYLSRAERYKKCADFVVTSANDKNETLKALLKKYNEFIK